MDTINAARAVIRGLLDELAKHRCEHENTYRGGAIWEICRDCGAKWADDRGGKPPPGEPLAVTAATAFLAQTEVVDAEVRGRNLTLPARAALLWLLWHHQGGSSMVGQTLRPLLGIGRFDPLTDDQLALAKEWDATSPPELLTESPPCANLADGWTQWDGTARVAEWRSAPAWGGPGFRFAQEEPPSMPGIFLWSVREGPGCPVPAGTRVTVRFRDGEELTTDKPDWMRWAWTRPYAAAADIVAWRHVE